MLRVEFAVVEHGDRINLETGGGKFKLMSNYLIVLVTKGLAAMPVKVLRDTVHMISEFKFPAFSCISVIRESSTTRNG